MGTEIRTSGDAPMRVVAALALSPAARDLLVEEVKAEVVDIREADGSEELVLSPAVSWQLIGKLRQLGVADVAASKPRDDPGRAPRQPGDTVASARGRGLSAALR